MTDQGYPQSYIDDLQQISEHPVAWERLSGKTILVAGATGMIGSAIVDAVMYKNVRDDLGCKVFALSRSLSSLEKRFSHFWSREDLYLFPQNVQREFTSEHRFDYIIHAASPADPASFASAPVETMLANVMGVKNLLDLAREQKSERMLFISSGEVYGKMAPNIGAANEEYSGYIDPMTTRACYPMGKRAAETLCKCYCDEFGMDIVVARPCHTYGPTMQVNDSRAISSFIRDVKNNKDIIMKSKGEQVRSYCYVADVVTAILSILFTGERGTAYNIADKNSVVSIFEFAKLIAKAGKRDISLELPTQSEKAGYSTIDRQVLNPQRLESLGWRARTSLEQGVYKSLLFPSII